MTFSEQITAVLPEGELRARALEVLQANLGFRCNLSCKHCHVGAGPGRGELMGRDTMDAVLTAICGCDIRTLDITGGSPELHPDFRYMVGAARQMGRDVIVRTNLAVYFEPGMEDVPEFLAEKGVTLVASLPYYLEDTVDRVRGKGVFDKCMEALRRLNSLGFGTGRLGLHLVHNPPGAFLPPVQGGLEEEFSRELGARHGVRFDRLFTFANMPVGRFREHLESTDTLEKYMDRLASSFNPQTLEGLMCRVLVSVGWDGTLYDCDFNLALGLPVESGVPGNVRGFDCSGLVRRRIAVGDHCFGCTAGQGST